MPGTVRGEEILLKEEDGVNVYTLRNEAVKVSRYTRLPDVGSQALTPSRVLHYPGYVCICVCVHT